MGLVAALQDRRIWIFHSTADTRSEAVLFDLVSENKLYISFENVFDTGEQTLFLRCSECHVNNSQCYFDLVTET